MLKIKTVIILILLGIEGGALYAQSIEEMQQMTRLMSSAESHAPAYREYAKRNTTEWELAISGLFLFYKSFISSQDGNKCSFHPSCSEYAVLSIKKKGLFVGILSTFDRLTRCNGLSPELYPKDYKRKVLIDHP